MSKKVLILSASPRKNGNSDILCDQFAKGAEESGHQVEKIFFKDKNINYCTGCSACLAYQKPCPQKDDMAEILNQMIEADVIVMATPVYFYAMDAQMKTLIDRTCARYTEITGKDFYFIMTANDNNISAMDGTLTGFRGFLSCLTEPKEKGFIYGIGVFGMGDIKSKPEMQLALEMGRNV